ncbi:hypothetical protein [Streptomyces microflavus]|uniref:hypothetical protein n=1 Tax=Streptomyces microflavus TaxID=1919 RepID=UPI0037FF7E8A
MAPQAGPAAGGRPRAEPAARLAVLRARDVRPVTFHGTDAPEGLRAWAGDEGLQDEAICALESGHPALLTVVDPAVGLRVTLVGCPVGAPGGWPVGRPGGWPVGSAHQLPPY